MNTLTNRSRTTAPAIWNSEAIDYHSVFGNFHFTRPLYLGTYLFSRIDDVWGKPRDRDGLWPNSDTMQRAFDATSLKPVVPWEQYGAGSTQYCIPTDGALPRCSESIVFNVPFASDDLVYEFAWDSFQKFSTQIPTDVSIANFVWELQEVGQLLPSLEKNVQKTISGAYLSEKFGWEPLLKDLQVLTGILSTVQRKINFLKSTYGKKIRLGNYRGDALTVGTGSLSPHNQLIETWDSPDRREAWVLKRYRCDLRAGGRLYHELEGLNDLYGYCRAMLVALGLDNPLKAVWQAIPYSFVVDWFLGLSRKLGGLSINPFKGQFQVSDFSVSVSTVFEWSVSQVSAPSGSTPLGVVRAKQYERISRLPVQASYLTLNALSPQQLLLASAMLAQH